MLCLIAAWALRRAKRQRTNFCVTRFVDGAPTQRQLVIGDAVDRVVYPIKQFLDPSRREHLCVHYPTIAAYSIKRLNEARQDV